MEIVDIVDEQGNVLYPLAKDEAHAKGLLHKCVIAEVINSKGEMMMIKPYSHKQDAGQYVSPVGGHVSSGEDMETALRREVMEEIGIRNFTFKFKGKAIFDRHVLGRHENHYFFIYEIYTDDIPHLGDEAKSYKWFTIEELKNEIINNKAAFGDAFFAVLNCCYENLLP